MTPGRPKAPETPPHIPVSRPLVGNSREDVQRVPNKLDRGNAFPSRQDGLTPPVLRKITRGYTR